MKLLRSTKSKMEMEMETQKTQDGNGENVELGRRIISQL